MISRSHSIACVRSGFGIVAVATLLYGCSSESGTDISDLWKIAKISLGSDDQEVTLQQAASTPYASIGVRLGKNPQQILVLASDNGQQQLWTSAARIAVLTQNGRVIRTAGLPKNLSGFAPRAGQQIAPIAGNSVSYLADFADMGAYSIEVSCHAVAAGAESINILGATINADHVDEECLAPKIGWAFTNSYWVDPSGKITWRSIQYFHPETDPLEIVTLRPIAG